VKRWQVVIVHERSSLDNLPRSQQVMLSGLGFRELLKKAGHHLVAGGIVDKDIKDKDRNVPPALVPYLYAAAGKALPRLCISPVEGGKVREFPLPADAAAVLNLLGKEK